MWEDSLVNGIRHDAFREHFIRFAFRVSRFTLLVSVLTCIVAIKCFSTDAFVLFEAYHRDHVSQITLPVAVTYGNSIQNILF